MTSKGTENQLFSIEDALDAPVNDLKNIYSDHVNPGFVKMLSLLGLDKKFVRASGTKVWDSEGTRYLDFLGGFGALNFGHNHPRIKAAVDQVADMPNILQSAVNSIEAAAAYNLAQITPEGLTHTFFCNSGTEAVEGALKLARITTGRKKVIYCKSSFHGKSLGSLSVTGRKKYQDNYQPLLPECSFVTFGNVEELGKKLYEEKVAAFIVEPIQGEGGINLPPGDYLKECQKLCQEYGTLLILDEIQTGFGRTGYDFACQSQGVEPDILCMAKSLGGGIIPVGAFSTREEIWKKAYGSIDKCLLHSSTFGGNTKAAASVIASIEVLKNEDLSKAALEKGQYLFKQLRKIADKHKLVKDIRGQGLLLGIEFNQPTEGLLVKLSGGIVNRVAHEYLGAMVCGALHNKQQIITAYTLNNPNVIRLEPPLTVSYEELDQLVKAMDDILSNSRGFWGFAASSTKAVIESFFKN